MCFLCCSMYFCVVLCIVCFVSLSVLFVYMCTELLPLSGYPIAVNRYIKRTRLTLGPLSFLATGEGAGVIRLGSDADHSPLSAAEAKNEWHYTSMSPTCSHGIHVDSFSSIRLDLDTQISEPV
jgi:hypothetical protein